MPPNKYPKGTYGRSIVSQSCAIGVHAIANGRDFFNEIEQFLFWNLTGESVESFLQIVRDVGPTVFSQTRRGNRRQIHYPFTFRSLAFILSELTMHFKRESVSESCIDYYSWYKHAPNLITQS
jgi:hypothetical protein